MFLDNCNCAYTTSKGEKVGVSISALTKLMTELPEVPKLFTMPIEIFRHPLLPKNYIMLSNTVADAFEKAIEEHKK